MELLGYAFFRNALLGILLISITSAIIGTYIVTRRLASLAGGVTHACFGGLGLGYFLGWNPLWPAMAFAMAASLGVERLSSRGRMRSDSAIAVVWALGMAVGVVCVFLTPGYVPELNAFLFGNILTISPTDLWLEGSFAAVLTLLFALRGRVITACAFDPDFARVAGLPARTVNGMMTVLTSIGIVLIIKLVGVMLLMSMLVLPPLTAECLTRSYRRIMVLSGGVCMASSCVALWLSSLIDVPCSAFIVLVQALVYAAARLLRRTSRS